MPLGYLKPTEKIGQKLRTIIEAEFNNVYLSSNYQELGNESIRIDVLSSDLKEQISATMEIRDYEFQITIYSRDNSKDHDLHLNNRIDRLVFWLMKHRTLSFNNLNPIAVDLVVDSVNYKEETGDDDILAGSLSVTITKENIF